MHTKLIEDKLGREYSCVVEQLSGCARKVTITRVSRVMEQKSMSMVAIIDIAGKC